MPTEGNAVKDHAAETVIGTVASKVAVGGGSTLFLFGWSINEFVALGGLAVAIVGLVVNFYYKRKADKRHSEADRRAAELHAKRMAGD